MLTLSAAQIIINGALIRARQLNLNVSVAVCDATGRLIALNQMDGSVGWEVDRWSMEKRLPPSSPVAQYGLFERLGPGGLRLSSHSNVVPPRGQQGGLPIVEAGIVQGGCGVSGAIRPEQDEECARAGIAAFKTSATEPTSRTYPDRPLSPISMASSA